MVFFLGIRVILVLFSSLSKCPWCKKALIILKSTCWLHSSLSDKIWCVHHPIQVLLEGNLSNSSPDFFNCDISSYPFIVCGCNDLDKGIATNINIRVFFKSLAKSLWEDLKENFVQPNSIFIHNFLNTILSFSNSCCHLKNLVFLSHNVM